MQLALISCIAGHAVQHQSQITGHPKRPDKPIQELYMGVRQLETCKENKLPNILTAILLEML